MCVYFLDFTRRRCLQLFSVSLDKKSFAFQSGKESYLKIGLSFDISFAVPLRFINLMKNKITFEHLYDSRG